MNKYCDYDEVLDQGEYNIIDESLGFRMDYPTVPLNNIIVSVKEYQKA